MTVIALVLVSPWIAVLGAACVSIPIIIHLLSRRQRRPIDWAAMQFIIEAWRNQRRRLRLQNLILLFIRCLIPLVLGFALAQPIVNGSSFLGSSKTINHIVIDNSPASGAIEGSGSSAFKGHIQTAGEIIQSSNDGDEFRILPLSHHEQSFMNPTGNQENLLELLQQMTESHHPADLELVLRDIRSKTQLDSSRIHNVFLLSGFREGTARVEDAISDVEFDSARTNLQYSKPSTESIEIVRVVGAEPARRITLRGGGIESLLAQCVVRLERDGNKLARSNTTITAINRSGSRTDRDVIWEDGQREMVVDMVLPVSPDDLRVSSISISTGSLPSQVFHTTVEVEDSLRVVLLDRNQVGREAGRTGGDSGRWMERALRPTRDIPIDIREIDPASLSKTDLLQTDAVFVLRPDLLEADMWSEISDFLRNGGMVMITPPANREIHDWIDSMNEAFDLEWGFQGETVIHEEAVGIEFIETSDSILDVIGPELPSLTEPVRVNKIVDMDPGLQGTILMKDATGIPLLMTETSMGTGVLVVLSSAIDLEWTSLPAKPLMVPLIQESLRGGIQEGRSRKTIMMGEEGWRDQLPSSNSDLMHTDGSFIPIDDPESIIDKPGFWIHQDDSSGESTTISVNIRPESGDLDVQSIESVDDWLRETGEWSVLGEMVDEDSGGDELVWFMLILLAFLLVLESTLARVFSPPDESTTGGIGSNQIS